MRQFTAGMNEEGVRLSRFVLRVTHRLPNNLLYKSFRNRRIKVNGKRGHPDTTLHAGDLIELYLHDEFFQKASVVLDPCALSDPAEMVYEDDSIAILHKPAGVLSHRDDRGNPGLVENYLARWASEKADSPEAENHFAPAAVGRLDRNTEGLVLLAKNHPALRELNQLTREGLIAKKYLCITQNRPPEGHLRAYLKRDRQQKKVEIYDTDKPFSKPIETGVHILEQKKGLALCEIDLITGRTHQIRAHLAHLGCPLLGERKYGSTSFQSSYPGPAQALCAWKMRFPEEIDASSPLSNLSGKEFSIKNPELLAFWRTLGAPQATEP